MKVISAAQELCLENSHFAAIFGLSFRVFLSKIEAARALLSWANLTGNFLVFVGLIQESFGYI